MHKLYRFPCALGIGLGFLLQARTVQAQDAAFGDAAGGMGSNASSTAAVPAGTNIATGTISPTVPLITLPGVSGGVTVSLRYTAGTGVKVNDVATEVGLGWMLVGGGSITREVKGRPDDGEFGWFKVVNYRNYFPSMFGGTYPGFPTQTAGNLVTYFKNKNNNQYTYQGNTVTFGANEAWCSEYLYSASQAVSFSNYAWGQYNTLYQGPAFVDTESDVYTITLPIGGVQFVFDEIGNPIALQGQNIKIEALNLGARGQSDYLQEFRVTTSDGTQYLFGSPVGTDEYKEKITVSTATTGAEPIPSKEDYKCTYKWLLKKITTPIGEEINYAYNAGIAYQVTTNNYIQQDYVYALQGGQPASTSYTQYLSSGFWSRKYTIRTTAASADCRQLASISSALGTLEFAYQDTPRQDIGGGTKALTSLRLRNKQGMLIKQLDLVQHYAFASMEAQALPSDSYHLLLDKILDKGTGCDNIEEYSFAYNQTTFCRNTASKDNWGYFNNSATPSTGELVGGYTSRPGAPQPFTLTGRDRTPSASYAQAMLLQSIHTAQGGIQSFEYELHEANPTYSLVPISGAIGGLRVKRVSQYDGVDHNNDIIDTFFYQNSTGASSGSFGDQGLYAKLKFMHGKSKYYFYTSQFFTDTQIRGIIPVCDYFDANKYSPANLDSYYLMRSDASLYQYANDYVEYKYVTIDHGSKGKTQYEFTSWDDASHRDYTDVDTRLQAGGTHTNPCTNDPLNTTGKPYILPLPFSLDLYGLDLQYVGGGSTADFPCRTSRAVERGLLMRMTQLSTTNIPVAVTTNEYDFTAGASLPKVNALVVKPDMEVLGFSQNFNYFELYYYQYQTAWCPLIKTTQLLYDQQAAGDVTKTLKNVTDVTYANFFPNKISKYTTTAAATPTTKYVTEFRRPQDFTGGDADQTTTPGLLRKVGMMATVVEQEDYVEQTTGASSTKIPKGASLAEYQLLNGQVLPYKTYAARLGLTSFAPASTSQNGTVWTLNRDANYELVSTLASYTADSRPVSTLDRSGISKATIWGYGHTLPIATVTNGTAATGTTGDGLLATAAHTSFEEDGVNGIDGDGWSIPTFCLTEAKTGNRSARIVVNQSQYGPGKVITLEAGANRHGKMTYSCWVKVPKNISNPVYLHLVVAGVGPNSSWQDSVYQISPNQDWQYVEKIFNLDAPKMNSGLSSTDRLSIVMYPWCPSGSELLVDEVRVHRLDASMQTTTYTPLIGKTSTTDPSGVTTYYTYDSNNYPRLVLNQKRDIVQRTQQHLPGPATRPNADFNVPDIVAQGCPAKFVAIYSTCTNASDITYTWDFGDGSTVVNGDAVQNHLYTAQGTYTISLLVADPVKGASRLTKTVTVIDAFYTDLSPGDVDINLCDNPAASVTLTALVPAATCQTVTYQWQVASGGSWTNLAGTTQSITQRVAIGTRQYRCVITIAGLGNNSASPTIPVMNITGYYPPNIRDCNTQGPTPAAQAARK